MIGQLMMACILATTTTTSEIATDVYRIYRRREQTYGSPIGSFSATSFVYCGVLCSELGTCLSVTYDVTSRVCNLNSMMVPSTLWNCSSGSCVEPPTVAYGVKKGCTIRNPCTGSAECTDGMAVCRDGLCKCSPGLHHDPNTCSCVSSCIEEFGSTFQVEVRQFIPSSNREFIHGITDAECRQACLEATSYPCRTYEFCTSDQSCRTSNETSLTKQPYPNGSTTLYTRDCAYIAHG